MMRHAMQCMCIARGMSLIRLWAELHGNVASNAGEMQVVVGHEKSSSFNLIDWKGLQGGECFCFFTWKTYPKCVSDHPLLQMNLVNLIWRVGDINCTCIWGSWEVSNEQGKFLVEKKIVLQVLYVLELVWVIEETIIGLNCMPLPSCGQC